MTAGNEADTSLGARSREIAARHESSARTRVPMAPPGAQVNLLRALRRAFSFPVFLGALLVGGVFLTLDLNLSEVASTGTQHTNSFVEGDTWWHIEVGQRILSTHVWPTSEPYSFTAKGDDWIAYEWLGEVPLALAARIGGLRGLAALLIALTSTLLLLLYYYSYLRCGNAKAAFVACVVLLSPAAVCFSLRPQLIGYVFLLITLICLERFRLGRRRALWILPMIFALWANTHGSFVFGLFALGLYWAAGLARFKMGSLEAEPWTPQQRQHLAFMFLLCLLALNITPYGTRIAANPFEMAFAQPVNIASVQEWQPMPFGLLPGKIFLAIVLLFLVAQLVFRFKYRVEELTLLLLAIYAACVHRRFILLFAVIFAPWIARLLAQWVPGYYADRDRYLLNFALIVLISLGIVKFFPGSQELDQVIGNGFPVGAVNYLREHPAPGPVFNEYFWGGYIIHTLGARQRVFIDGRADVYEHGGVHSDYLRIIDLDQQALWLLRKYGIRACLIRRGTPLATLIGALPDWEQVYADHTSLLFFRRTNRPQGQDLAVGTEAAWNPHVGSGTAALQRPGHLSLAAAGLFRR
jgi:hypothetical protein